MKWEMNLAHFASCSNYQLQWNILRWCISGSILFLDLAPINSLYQFTAPKWNALSTRPWVARSFSLGILGQVLFIEQVLFYCSTVLPVLGKYSLAIQQFFWDSLFKCEKLFEVPGHATEVRTHSHHFSVACSISECKEWHWKKGVCSAREKEEWVCLEGEKEEGCLKKRENTWEKGRVNVRGRAQILVQVRNSLVIQVFNLYPE